LQVAFSNGTRTAINGRVDTVLASLVRVAPSFHFQERRKSTTGVAAICRAEMD